MARARGHHRRTGRISQDEPGRVGSADRRDLNAVAREMEQRGLLFPAERRPPRVLMHVMDAGDVGVQFRCARCGHETGWISGLTVTKAKRGLPCPDCNQEREP